MTTWTTIALVPDPTGQRTLFWLDEAPAGAVPQPCEWEVDASDVAFAALDAMPFGGGNEDAVRAAGEALATALRSSPDVAAALDALVNDPDGPHELRLRLRSRDGHDLPWEALFADRFVALDDRWPVVRIADDGRSTPLRTRVLDRPLRVTAIIAAEGIPSEAHLREAEALREAATGHDVDLSIVTSDDQVVADGGEHVRPSVEDLVEQVALQRPHLVHLFCHGRGDAGGSVEIALRGGIAGPLVLSAGELARFGTPLLAVLNCCESAAVTALTASLAHQLVTAGVPAVVGMRTPVDTVSATAFTGALYRKVFALLDDALAAGQEVELGWTGALPGPRRKLAEQLGARLQDAAARRKEWTIPLMYVQRNPLRVRPMAPDRAAGLDVEAEALAADTLRELVAYMSARSESVTAALSDELASLEQDLAGRGLR